MGATREQVILRLDLLQYRKSVIRDSRKISEEIFNIKILYPKLYAKWLSQQKKQNLYKESK